MDIYLQFTETNLQTRPTSAMKKLSVSFNNGVCSFWNILLQVKTFSNKCTCIVDGNTMFWAICLGIGIWYCRRPTVLPSLWEKLKWTGRCSWDHEVLWNYIIYKLKTNNLECVVGQTIHFWATTRSLLVLLHSPRRERLHL